MADATWTESNVAKESGDTVEFAEAGEAITAGNSIFIDSDDKMYKVDATSETKPDSGDDAGVAVNGGAIGQLIPYMKRRGDKVNYGASTFTAGQWYVGSNTAGGLKPAGDLASTEYSVGMGYAETDAILVLRPDRTGVQLS